MLTTDNINQWALITERIWRMNIAKYKIGDTQNLINSFKHHINFHSNGDVGSIDLSFLMYGRFVDMGVGKETFVGNTGNTMTKRKRKVWYSKTIYSEIKRLTELMADAYQSEATTAILIELTSQAGDLKYNQYRDRSHRSTSRVFGNPSRKKDWERFLNINK